jgi:hypothetical protein
MNPGASHFFSVLGYMGIFLLSLNSIWGVYKAKKQESDQKAKKNICIVYNIEDEKSQ